jgi:hypothetical protein
LDRVGDRVGQRLEWSGVGDARMRSVRVVEDLVLTQRVQEMALVPDQCSVEEIAAVGAYPPFHERVHAGHSDAAVYDGDPLSARIASNRLHVGLYGFKAYDV